jgi:hypothetical protein
MTVTYVNESGTGFEPFDETIRAKFAANWTSANTGGLTPSFKSAFGTNVSHSWVRTFGANEIHFNEDESTIELPTEEANGNTWIGQKTLVYIDIFASSANNLKLFIREANRIIWELNPNGANRITKSNASDNSAIDHFDRYTVMFRKERQLMPNMKIQAHASGTLGIIWYKIRS